MGDEPEVEYWKCGKDFCDICGDCLACEGGMVTWRNSDTGENGQACFRCLGL